MKTRLLTATLSAFIAICALSNLHTFAQTKPKLKLVWSEEFNYKGLPDPKKWDYEQGYVRNKESQYYTKARKENAVVYDGLLHIIARKEQIPNEVSRRNPGDTLTQYTSACIITKGKASWQYGRIDVRAKLPKGGGVWPAIWMLGANIDKVGWPISGEIDIMEYVDSQPDRIHANIHYADNLGKHASNGHQLKVPLTDTAFHVYSMDWTKDHITILYDGQPFHSYDLIDKNNTGDAFHKPFYLMLNFALGAWGGTINDDNLPQTFLVDYVRVYQ